LKYFTIKNYEDVKLFLNRVKHELGHDNFYAKMISKEMGAGDKIIELIDKKNPFEIIKLDGPSDKMNELYEELRIRKEDKVIKYPGEKPVNNPAIFKKPIPEYKKPKNKVIDGFEGIRDLEW
jgi:hypothetical protein